jgi:integrase
MLYLGTWNSPESKTKYEEILTEWLLQNDRSTQGQIRTDELVLLYLDHTQEYHRKDGELTSEYSCIKSALRFVVQHCARVRVREFGPKLLKEVRDCMIAAEFTRSTINKHVGRIRRMFRWGVENEYIPVEVLTALQSVAGLRKGRSQAKESEPVKSVPQEHVEAILPIVSPPVANMIRFQQLTGMRPEEVVELREGEIDRSEEIWQYVPRSHKTEHHDKDRMIFIGPKAQSIITPMLSQNSDQYVFRPADAVTYKHTYGERYSVDSYRRAIQRACKRAKVPSWSPNQLRHTAGTEIRKKFGLEASQVVLGHANAKVTEIYAERNMDLAREIMAKVG